MVVEAVAVLFQVESSLSFLLFFRSNKKSMLGVPM